jgi:hypothetical protein
VYAKSLINTISSGHLSMLNCKSFANTITSIIHNQLRISRRKYIERNTAKSPAYSFHIDNLFHSPFCSSIHSSKYLEFLYRIEYISCLVPGNCDYFLKLLIFAEKIAKH